MRVLAVNAGASSLKLAVLEDERTVGERTVERWSGEDASAVSGLLEETGPVDVVGHRVAPQLVGRVHPAGRPRQR